jgi:hypothetical protein
MLPVLVSIGQQLAHCLPPSLHVCRQLAQLLLRARLRLDSSHFLEPLQHSGLEQVLPGLEQVLPALEHVPTVGGAAAHAQRGQVGQTVLAQLLLPVRLHDDRCCARVLDHENADPLVGVCICLQGFLRMSVAGAPCHHLRRLWIKPPRPPVRHPLLQGGRSLCLIGQTCLLANDLPYVTRRQAWFKYLTLPHKSVTKITGHGHMTISEKNK